jgi:hypothetical protein
MRKFQRILTKTGLESKWFGQLITIDGQKTEILCDSCELRALSREQHA